jgi:hypothetical protein
MKLILNIFLAVLVLQTLIVNAKRIDYDLESSDDEQQERTDKLIDNIAQYLDEEENSNKNENGKTKTKKVDNFQYIPTTTIDSKLSVTQPKQVVPTKKASSNDHETDNSNSWTVFFILCVLGTF